MAEPVLNVNALRVEFPTRTGVLTAVDGVSLHIDRGEILGVVGESGAGKSMTGMAILGLIEPPGRIAAGEIYLSGQRIDQLSDEALSEIRGKRIGAIFQDPLTSLHPLFTVGQQLCETISFHLHVNKTQARRRALELLKEVGIPAPDVRIDHFPHQFSGGMRQRVVIALALCAEPELIIADEPTTALDVSIQAQITGLLRRLCKERGMAVMLVTHDMGVIAETVDRVAVLYAGRIAEVGDVMATVNTPRHPYTVGLMASIPSLSNDVSELTQIPGNMPRLTSIPSGCAFNPRCTRAFERCRIEAPDLSQAGVACWAVGEETL